MSQSKLLGIGFLLLVAGFVLGRVITTTSDEATSTATAVSQEATPPKPNLRAAKQEPSEFVAAILRDVMSDTDPYSRITRLAALLPALGPDLAPEIQDLLEDDTIDVGPAELDLLLRWWANSSPLEANRATSWALVHLQGESSAVAARATIESWAAIDPLAAGNMVQNMGLLPNVASRAAQIALVRGWYLSGQPGLIEYVQGLGISFERQRAVAALARLMLQNEGAEAVIRWADAIPDDDVKFKLDVNTQTMSVVARFSPADAVAWCDRICDGPTETTTTTRKMLATRWAEQDPAAAMAWLAGAPPGKERDWAVRAAVRAWSRRDRAEFRAWAEDMGPDNVEPFFQPGLELLANAYIFDEPEKAVEWAGAIEDDAVRRGSYMSLARLWRKRDPVAADAWIEEMDFPEDMRERIFNPPAPAKPPGPGRTIRGGGAAEDANATAGEADPSEATP